MWNNRETFAQLLEETIDHGKEPRMFLGMGKIEKKITRKETGISFEMEWTSKKF